ncbi:thermonuclease family protein [bacterium]|nr:thermonuclease family protein [bacterium]
MTAPNRFQGLVLASAFLSLFALDAQAQKYKATVIKITDGDTLKIIPDNAQPGDKPVDIRMLGYDTPELHLFAKVNGKSRKFVQKYGPESTDAMVALLHAKPAVLHGTRLVKNAEDVTTGKPIRVEVETAGLDQHDRTLGTVYFTKADGKVVDVNLEIVKLGWAHPYIYCAHGACPPDFLKLSKAEEFSKACKEARQKHLGIFNAQDPIKETASEFRRVSAQRQPYQYIGVLETKTVYPPGADADRDASGEYKLDPCSVIRFDTEELAYDLGFRKP